MYISYTGYIIEENFDMVDNTNVAKEANVTECDHPGDGIMGSQQNHKITIPSNFPDRKLKRFMNGRTHGQIQDQMCNFL
jgi:hypothetical protein